MARELSTKRTLSQEQIAAISRLRELSFGNRLIAREIGIPRLVVCYWLRKLGYKQSRFTPETRGFRHFSPETIAQVVALRKQGVSNREIGVQTGMTEKSANQILRRLGWRADMLPIQARARPLITPEKIEQILELHAQGYGRKFIGRRLEINEYTARKILHRAGYKRPVCTEKKPRQVRDDVSYLILTPETAWSLGVLYGDGCLSRNRIQVSLTSGDKDIVEKFAQIHGTLKLVGQENRWTTTWSSARLYRELATYGLCPNKSGILQFPKLDPKMMPHFVRGLIDSDGSFHRAGSGSLAHLLRFHYACICEPFMHDLRDVLVEQAGLSPESEVRGRYQSDTPNKVWKLKYSHTDAVRLGYWVYADSTPETRCDRKHAIWDAARQHVLCKRNTERTNLPSYKIKPKQG